jgi:CsoR family transcriptional regulator, copper-sensing transcriptional repressor
MLIDNTLVGYYHRGMTYNKKSTSHRLKIIAGQINALSKMIEEDKYCMDILTQSLAIQKALKEIDKMVLKNHINSCVIDQIRTGDEEKATEELLRYYTLSVKNI